MVALQGKVWEGGLLQALSATRVPWGTQGGGLKLLTTVKMWGVKVFRYRDRGEQSSIHGVVHFPWDERWIFSCGINFYVIHAVSLLTWQMTHCVSGMGWVSSPWVLPGSGGKRREVPTFGVSWTINKACAAIPGNMLLSLINFYGKLWCSWLWPLPALDLCGVMWCRQPCSQVGFVWQGNLNESVVKNLLIYGMSLQWAMGRESNSDTQPILIVLQHLCRG